MTWFGSVFWVGLLATAVAFAVDGFLWSFVFHRGMEVYTSAQAAPGRAALFVLMGKQLANTLVFGIFFTLLYKLVQPALLMEGALSGLVYGLLLWLPTIAVESFARAIWWDRARRLARASFWANLIKFAVTGVVVSLFL